MSIGEDGFTENSVKYFPKVYLCDPKKNKDCRKTICYEGGMLSKDYGECKYTTNPEYSKDRKAYIYDPETHEFVEVKK